MENFSIRIFQSNISSTASNQTFLGRKDPIDRPHSTSNLFDPFYQPVIMSTDSEANKVVQQAQSRTSDANYASKIADCFTNHQQITGDTVAIDGIERIRGKVRDNYKLGNGTLALVTTDRQSGFDRALAQVPFKGAVLNLTSAYWFQQTASIIPNHIVAIPHPYVSIVKECKPFPIEFVVRYVTGEIYPFYSLWIYIPLTLLLAFLHSVVHI